MSLAQNSARALGELAGTKDICQYRTINGVKVSFEAVIKMLQILLSNRSSRLIAQCRRLISH